MNLVGIPSEADEVVGIPLRARRIHQNSFRSGQDQPKFPREQVGLVKILLRASEIGQKSFRSGRGWLESFRELVILVRIPSEACGIGQNSFTIFFVRKHFFLCISVREGRNSQNSFRSRWKCFGSK